MDIWKRRSTFRWGIWACIIPVRVFRIGKCAYARVIVAKFCVYSVSLRTEMLYPKTFAKKKKRKVPLLFHQFMGVSTPLKHKCCSTQTNKKKTDCPFLRDCRLSVFKWLISVNGSWLFDKPVFVAPTTNAHAHTHRHLATSLQGHFAALKSIVWWDFEFPLWSHLTVTEMHISACARPCMCETWPKLVASSLKLCFGLPNVYAFVAVFFIAFESPRGKLVKAVMSLLLCTPILAQYVLFCLQRSYCSRFLRAAFIHSSFCTSGYNFVFLFNFAASSTFQLLFFFFFFFCICCDSYFVFNICKW